MAKPLMGEWSDHLVKALAARNPACLRATGLASGMSGEQFERQLGGFLRRVEAFNQIDLLLESISSFAPSAVCPLHFTQEIAGSSPAGGTVDLLYSREIQSPPRRAELSKSGDGSPVEAIVCATVAAERLDAHRLLWAIAVFGNVGRVHENVMPVTPTTTPSPAMSLPSGNLCPRGHHAKTLAEGDMR